MASKNPNWSKPLAYAGLLTVLSTGVYWLEFKKKPETEKKKEQEKKIFAIESTQVSEITMIQGISRIRLGCLDLAAKQCLPGSTSKWEVQTPVRLLADDSNVQGLLSSINNLFPTDSVDLTKESPEKKKDLLSQYGLDETQRKSASRVDVLDEAGQQTSIVFGDRHPMGGSIFALIERGKKDQVVSQDSKVLLISEDFKESVSKSLTHWRNKKIVTLQAAKIGKIQAEVGKSRFEASRKDGAWTLNGRQNGKESGPLPGDIENIDNWTSALSYLSASNFADEQKTSTLAKKLLAGSKSISRITLSEESGSQVKLELFQKKTADIEKLFVTVSNLDPLFELDLSARPSFEKTLSDLRLTRLLGSMDRFNAHEVSFSSSGLGKDPITFTKKDGKWTRASSKAEPHDDSRVTSILDSLSGKKVKSFLPANTPTKDALEISLKDEKSQLLRKLTFWKEGEKLFAKDLLSARQESLEIEPALSSALPWKQL